MGTTHPLILILAFWAWCLAALPAWAHPGHASEAELDWNTEQTRLEVSLALLPEHLEEAIGLRLSAPGAEQRIEDYLQRHFRLLGDEAGPGRIALVGVEEEYRRSWLYFTVERPPGERLTLEFTALQELYSGQVNRARLLWAPGASTLVFSPGSGPLELPAIAREPSAQSAL